MSDKCFAALHTSEQWLTKWRKWHYPRISATLVVQHFLKPLQAINNHGEVGLRCRFDSICAAAKRCTRARIHSYSETAALLHNPNLAKALPGHPPHVGSCAPGTSSDRQGEGRIHILWSQLTWQTNQYSKFLLKLGEWPRHFRDQYIPMSISVRDSRVFILTVLAVGLYTCLLSWHENTRYNLFYAVVSGLVFFFNPNNILIDIFNCYFFLKISLSSLGTSCTSCSNWKKDSTR